MRTRIKVCGITRAEDALVASRLGVDALGLNFYEPSPRAVTLDKALEIRNALPPFVCVVTLFVNETERRVREVVETLTPDCLQFHGDESPAYCELFGLPYIKAIRVRESCDIANGARTFSRAQALLLDTWHKEFWGGSGRTFDWQLAPQENVLPIVLAGGLTPENVGEAITTVKPYAVDVCGGVESSKGIKSHDKIRSFVDAVSRCHDEVTSTGVSY